MQQGNGMVEKTGIRLNACNKSIYNFFQAPKKKNQKSYSAEVKRNTIARLTLFC